MSKITIDFNHMLTESIGEHGLTQAEISVETAKSEAVYCRFGRKTQQHRLA